MSTRRSRLTLRTVALEGPIVVLGSARSAALVDDGAFGGIPVHRYAGARSHNPRAAVEEAGALVDEHGCRSAVAIGSSSAIDLGKAVADRRDATVRELLRGACGA